jgi:histidinol-phosphate aminotransferase
MPSIFTRVLADLDIGQPFMGRRSFERARGRPYKARLGANECLFGTSPAALRVFTSRIDELAFYADPTHAELREMIAKSWCVPRQSIVVAEGIEGLLGLLVRACVEPGDIAVNSQGGYPSFDYYVRGCGGRLVRPRYLDCGTNDLEALLDAARRHRAKLVYLANPDNPTGTVLAPHDIRQLRSLLPANCLLLLDEAYFEFASADDILPSGESPANLVRLRTFSKAYGLAGLRIGYAVGQPEIIEPLERIRQHFAVTGLAQEMAKAAFEDFAFVEDVAMKTQQGREHYAAIAADIDATILPSSANFVAFDFGDERRAASAAKWLDGHDIFVRRVTEPPLGRLVRITVGPPEVRAFLAEVLGDDQWDRHQACAGTDCARTTAP